MANQNYCNFRLPLLPVISFPSPSDPFSTLLKYWDLLRNLQRLPRVTLFWPSSTYAFQLLIPLSMWPFISSLLLRSSALIEQIRSPSFKKALSISSLVALLRLLVLPLLTLKLSWVHHLGLGFFQEGIPGPASPHLQFSFGISMPVWIFSYVFSQYSKPGYSINPSMEGTISYTFVKAGPFRTLSKYIQLLCAVGI